jgi:hypothetical protein
MMQSSGLAAVEEELRQLEAHGRAPRQLSVTLSPVGGAGLGERRRRGRRELGSAGRVCCARTPCAGTDPWHPGAGHVGHAALAARHRAPVVIALV